MIYAGASPRYYCGSSPCLALVLTPPNPRRWQTWSKIAAQRQVRKDNVLSVKMASEEIWAMTVRQEEPLEEVSVVYQSETSTKALADKALENWIQFYLLNA